MSTEDKLKDKTPTFGNTRLCEVKIADYGTRTNKNFALR